MVGLCWKDQLHFEESVGGTLSQNFFEFIELKFNYRDTGS